MGAGWGLQRNKNSSMPINNSYPKFGDQFLSLLESRIRLSHKSRDMERGQRLTIGTAFVLGKYILKQGWKASQVPSQRN